jgi:hypothetical protein
MNIYRAATSRTGRLVILIALLVGGWQLWLTTQANAKIPPDLVAYRATHDTADLRIILKFPPERFHILVFQTFGRVSGTEGDTVEVRGVPVQRIWGIAKFYWVKQISMLPAGR